MEPITPPGYILFEGLDFTGKSTIAQRLAKKLNAEGPLSAIYKKGFFHCNHLEETETLAAKLNPKYKEMYFKSLYALDKINSNLPYDLVVQDRYFPSIIFYGMIVNGSEKTSNPEIVQNFILPLHIFLFECSYEAKRERANGRERYWRLERMVLESEENNRTMEQLYREVIQDIGMNFTLIDTSEKSEEETLKECYTKLVDSDILLEEVIVDDLFVSWEPKIYPSTAEGYAESLENGTSLKPLTIHRIFDERASFVRDLIEDGRHRAYAHYLAGRKTVKAFVRRVPMDQKAVEAIKFTSIKDFGVK